MAALIPNVRRYVSANLIFFMEMKTKQALSGTIATTYKVTEPHYTSAAFKNVDLANSKQIFYNGPQSLKDVHAKMSNRNRASRD